MSRSRHLSDSPVPDLAGELLDHHLEEMVAELFDDITTVEQVYEGELLGELDESIRANLRAALGDLARADGPSSEHPRLTARRRATQGVPLETVQHAFWLAFRTIWNHMVALAGDRGEPELHGLLQGGEVVWEAIDAYSAVVAVEYRAHATQAARRHERRRQAQLDALLSDELTSWALQAGAADEIGLPHDGRFVVVAAEQAAEPDDPPDDLEQHLARDGVASAWLPRTDGLLGVVHVTRQHTAEAIAAILESGVTGRTGISPPVDGLVEVAAAVPLAVAARNSFAPGRHAVTTVAQRPVAAIAAAAPRAVTRRVVDAVLGPVLALADEERELLLETLAAWFDSGGSTSATGAALFCHRNTVRNRLNRVRDLTGRDIEDPRDVADLRTALLAARLDDPSAGGPTGDDGTG